MRTTADSTGFKKSTSCESSKCKGIGEVLLPMIILTVLVQITVTQKPTSAHTGRLLLEKGGGSGVLSMFPSFSDLKQAILDRYGCVGEEEASLVCATRAMEKSEVDGEPVPIKGHNFIFISGVGAAYNLEELRKEGITHVISATPAASLRFPGYMEYLRVNVHDDGEPEDKIVPHLNATFDFIEDARAQGGRVLVHCWEGISRSVSIIMGYLIRKYGMTVDEAYDLISLTRPIADPNEDYWENLVKYAEQTQYVKSHHHHHHDSVYP